MSSATAAPIIPERDTVMGMANPIKATGSHLRIRPGPQGVKRLMQSKWQKDRH